MEIELETIQRNEEIQALQNEPIQTQTTISTEPTLTIASSLTTFNSTDTIIIYIYKNVTKNRITKFDKIILTLTAQIILLAVRKKRATIKIN